MIDVNDERDNQRWPACWRAFVPSLPTQGLLALREAIKSDDPRLLQGATTNPPPLACVYDWPIEAACLIGFCGWWGNDLHTVAEVSDFFARCCLEADRRMDEAAGCRHLLNFWDETPREEAFRLLLPEVQKALDERNGEGIAT